MNTISSTHSVLEDSTLAQVHGGGGKHRKSNDKGFWGKVWAGAKKGGKKGIGGLVGGALWAAGSEAVKRLSGDDS